MGDFEIDLARFRDFIRRAERKTGWKPTRIAREAGIKHTLITGRLGEGASSLPKRETIHKIEAATGVFYIDSHKNAQNPNDSADDSRVTGSYDTPPAANKLSEVASMTDIRRAAIILMSSFTPTDALAIVADAMKLREEKEQASPSKAGRML